MINHSHTSPIISIIVPVYNAEKYLHDCLDSILAQTMLEWECICIDDGSTDASMKILNDYASLDARFRILSQVNQGVSHTRNVGIKTAHAPFMMFVDADDWIDENMCEILYHGIINSDGDFCCCSYNIEDMMEQKSMIKKYYTDKYNDSSYNVLKPWQFINHTPFKSSCLSLFKKSIILQFNLTFPLGIKITEDAYFLISYLCHCRKCVYIPFCLYHYRKENTQSAVSLFDHGHLPVDDILNIFKLYHSIYTLIPNDRSRHEKRILLSALLGQSIETNLLFRCYREKYKIDNHNINILYYLIHGCLFRSILLYVRYCYIIAASKVCVRTRIKSLICKFR